jgi:hypothetical protein
MEASEFGHDSQLSDIADHELWPWGDGSELARGDSIFLFLAEIGYTVCRLRTTALQSGNRFG